MEQHETVLPERMRCGIHSKAYIRYFLRYEQSKAITLRKTIFVADDKIQLQSEN